jgi:hypothetical protein
MSAFQADTRAGRGFLQLATLSLNHNLSKITGIHFQARCGKATFRVPMFGAVVAI